MAESWRSMVELDQTEFRHWSDISLSARWELGREKYQSDVKGFQGDPIDHAIEECLDQLIYLFMAKRRHSELRYALEKAREE